MNLPASCPDVQALHFQLGVQWPKALPCLQLPTRRATEAAHLPPADVPRAPERLQVSVQQAPVRQARESPALPMRMR